MLLPRTRESGPRQARFPKSLITTTAAGHDTEELAIRNALVASAADPAVVEELQADAAVARYLRGAA